MLNLFIGDTEFFQDFNQGLVWHFFSLSNLSACMAMQSLSMVVQTGEFA